MLVSLTVGKVDAGVAVLLTQDKRLIEFPSILLPPDIASGSVVDINVSRNFTSEVESQSAFTSLQDTIYTNFGQNSPSAPVLRCRNATQTSIVLEWHPIQLATAELRSLSLYRDGNKAGNIPRPLEQTVTKISGLAIDTEYTFSLVLKTSAGTYSSDKLTVCTHKMTDLSGITVTPGTMPEQILDALTRAVDRIGATMIDTVRIDTTHFICIEGRGPLWEKAVEQNVPVVRPEWVDGCEKEGRLVPVKGYYLKAGAKFPSNDRGSLSSQPTQASVSDDRPQSHGSVSAAGAAEPPEVSRQSLPSTTEEEAAPDSSTINQNGVPPDPPPKDGEAVPAESKPESDDGYHKPTSDSSDGEEEKKGKGEGEGGNFSDVAL